MLYSISRGGWERKRFKCFFTYIHLDLFRSHPSTYRALFSLICVLSKISPVFHCIQINIWKILTNNKEVPYLKIMLFSSQIIGCVCYLFQKITIYLWRRKTNKWQFQLIRLKNIKIVKALLGFLFLEGQMLVYLPDYFHFHAIDLLKQYFKRNRKHMVENIQIF